MEQRITAASRSASAVWIAFLIIAAAAWAVTVTQARSMAMPAMMPLPAFLAFWIVMMIAMMFPSVAPTAMVWSNAIARTSSGAQRALRMAAFITGYLVAWAAFGAFAYYGTLQIAALLGRSPESARWIGAAIFLLAGIYQVTPFKRACLLHCRSPLAALVHYAQFPKRGRDVLVGLHHGAYCVGCCWALMALLLAAGIMNVAAMAAVAALIFLEKRWRRGETLSLWLGAAFGALAIMAIFDAGAFPGLR